MAVPDEQEHATLKIRTASLAGLIAAVMAASGGGGAISVYAAMERLDERQASNTREIELARQDSRELAVTLRSVDQRLARIEGALGVK